jgi:hypothetical protein
VYIPWPPGLGVSIRFSIAQSYKYIESNSLPRSCVTYLARFRKNGFQNRSALIGIQVDTPSFVHNVDSAAGFLTATKPQKPHAKHLVHAKTVGQTNQPDNHGSKHEKGVFACSTRRRRGRMSVGFQFLFGGHVVQHPCSAPEEQGTVCGHCWNALYVCCVDRINQDSV